MNTTNKIVAWLLMAILLVISGVAISLWTYRQIEEAGGVRKHTFAVLDGASELLSALKDAETGQRGYLLTGDDSFLEPYLAGRSRIESQLGELRLITLAPAARELLVSLAPLIDTELKEMSQVIQLRRDHDTAAALAIVRKGHGKQVMDSIRTEMHSFIGLEKDLLAQRETEFQSSMRNLSALIVTTTVLALLFVLSFAYLIYRETRQRLRNQVHVETQHLLETQEETNRKLEMANRTLLISEEKLAVTLNSIGDAVIATDAQACVTLLNACAEKLTGWSREDAIGRPVNEIFHIINQENRQPAAIPVIETLARGTIQGMANHTLLIARGGSECAIADSCAPIRERDGTVIGAVLVFRDVTEEYAAQLALRDSSALIQTMLNTVVDGIITVHASTSMIETVNPAAERMFGYAVAELIGKDITVLIRELDHDHGDNSLERYRASDEARGDGLGREATGRRKDGSLFPLEIAVSDMWLGGERHFTGILRDITKRKQTEEALQERNSELESARRVADKANLAKSDFLSSMSHELRTPLNAILGFAQLIESGLPAPTPVQKRNLDQILTAGWYLLELINEILDLALIESGRVTLSGEPISLVEVMLECRKMIEPQAQQRDIAMSFPRFAVRYFVKADRTRLKQVLINLLFNAIKYNKTGGSVDIAYALSGESAIRISIRDTGIGLTAEQLGQLFQPFNRLGKEAGVEEGTGIGLVVTKRLVEMMGGTIGADSSVGQGSTFWVELALTQAPQHHVVDISDPVETVLPYNPHGTLRRTLLYVEDNPANLELVEQLVARRPDLCLLSAADGNLGIEFARAYQPEVILMDINLPGISGIDAMKILHADPATAHIPIIAISANAVPRDIEKALEAGFIDYLTKPIKVHEFMETLEAALKLSQTTLSRVAN